MKTVLKILIAVIAALCVLKGVQIAVDLLYGKYGKRYIQANDL